MRFFIIAAALLTAACNSSTETAPGASGDAGGYAVEIRSIAGDTTYVVTAPDGRTAGARAAGGASRLLDAEALGALSTPPAGASDDRQETVSMRAPGFELSVRQDPDSAGNDGEGGRVSMRIGGERIMIDADEGQPGEDDDRAHVRISGMSEADIRELVSEAEELSPSVQAQLLAQLGLE